MTSINKEILTMLEILPEQEQLFAKEFIKKLVLAWDNDFTKLTLKEERALKIAEEEAEKGETYTLDETLKMLNLNKQELNLNE